jgi:hypothetical protein
MNNISNYFDTTISRLRTGDLTIDDPEWSLTPPTFEEYLTSGKYVTPVEFSPKQLESAIKILGTDPKKIFSPERKVSLGVFVVGKGGGKDWWTSYVMDYVITVLLHLRNPQRFLMINGNLDLLNVGIKGDQGEKVFFDYFKQRVRENKWILDNFVIREEGKIYSKPIYKSRGDITLSGRSAIFPNRIRCFSETSKNESWEGYNVIFFVLDEISGFVSEKQSSNGWKIFKTANSSCISRRTKKFRGMGIVISYPRKEKDDISLELYEKSKLEGNEYIFGIRCFAWHFKHSNQYSGETFLFHNPRINRAFGLPDDIKYGIRIPIEYEEDFRLDPEGSLTKYCALPPRATGDWIEYPELVLSAIDSEQKPMFLTDDYVVEKIDPETGQVHRFLAKKIRICTEADIDIRRNKSYVAWLDAAEVACDAVIAIGRKDIIMIEDEIGTQKAIEICRIVDVINWTPEPGLPIDLENVEQFLLTEIPKYINLREVGKDRWESATLSNKLIKKGIRSIRYNLSANHYTIAKYFFYSGNVRIFDEEKWVNRNTKELTSLEQFLALVNGARGPEKKPDLKKDKSDGIVGVINLLMGDEFTKKNRPNIQKSESIGKPVMVNNSPYSSDIYNGNVIPSSSAIDDGERKVNLGKPVIV